MIQTLKYYSYKGSLVIFDKYTIDTSGVIKNVKTGKIVRTRKKGNYNSCSVRDIDGNSCDVKIARALASTFYSQPPTPEHTADHIDRNPDNDKLENIRWLCKSGQRDNQARTGTLKTAFIVVRNAEEKYVGEWVEYLKDETNPNGRKYTKSTIIHYARKKHNGFTYKEYPDLPGEIWKEIIGSKSIKGHWEISDMNRVKYVTKHAENVLSGERLRLDKGYPTISINDKQWACHILAFKTFLPEEYANKKPNEMILHEDDNKLDFRPHKLRIGTRSENTSDAYDNGKYIGTKSARMKCASYVNDVFEKEHNSQDAAVRYLKSIGYEKASRSNIREALGEKNIMRYGRTWLLL